MAGPKQWARVVAVFALMLPGVLASSGSAWAQTPAPAAQNLRVGQKLSVVDHLGREFKGRVRAVGADSVTLAKGRNTVDVPYANIVKIDEPDDLKNGAVIGLVVGLAVFAVDAALASSDGIELNGGGYVVFGAMYAGLGASVGAGIDAIAGGDRTIYRRSDDARLTVAPMIGRDGTGVRVRFSW